ncbi:uncharacterized protein LOC110272053 [Arachis ipaensis]|uniref:uncharacterized protein LOC110272053 n=1 Tax=Arachis ipaensis TaxID=130454 RepID=UPI000A2AF26B|nr:uncharacterized protein LOC110272053 [Arachis ipaensis]
MKPESETHRTTALHEGVNRTIIASHQEAPNRNSPSSHHHRHCAAFFPNRRCAVFFPNRRCLLLPGVAESLLSAALVLLPVLFGCCWFAAVASLLLVCCIGRLWVVICETIVKKTRGPTQCLKIHARQLEDREQITLDSEGEAIGPTDEVVNNLSKFLGTVARNSDFCPLIYTNWKGIKDKEAIWEYVQAKFIIPTEGKRMVLARINDNWKGIRLQ